MKTLFTALLVLLTTVVVAAPVDTFVFETPEQEQVFHKLSNELRCLVCQNQSISDSNAGLAKDLRTEIHEMLLAGKSEDEIVEFMVDRYGDYVLYNPPLKPLTWLLWFGPSLVFVIALIYVISFIRNQSRKQAAGELTAEESERLRNLQADTEAENANRTKEGDRE